MNLLVTNTRNAQAYAIIRALRPHAEKIVATTEGDHRLSAWFSHAARSRLVDKRYYTPSPAADWRAGRIQRENTEREEAYIQAVLKICEKEKIDTIFPSFDPHVLVFAKNRKIFEERRILLPVPSYDAAVCLTDKHAVIQEAERHGIPCPKTFLPSHPDDLKALAERLGFPLVIKPRFSSASRGFAVIRRPEELPSRIETVRANHGWPILQEYIPGRGQKSVMMLIDSKGAVKELFCEQPHRSLPGHVTVEETIPPFPEAAKLASWLAGLGYRGPAFAQLKVDPSDSLPKLLEVNTRVSGGVWTEMEAGIDVPRLVLEIARGKEIDPQSYSVGVIEIDLFADLLSLGLFIGMKLSEKLHRLDQGPLPGLREKLCEYLTTYKTTGKVLDPYFRHFFHSPLASLTYWAQQVHTVWRNRQELTFH